MKIGKYEFPDAETFENLAEKIDRDVHAVAVLGFVTDRFHADVLWNDADEPETWEPYRVTSPVTNHRFIGYPYNQFKIE